jgi:hypothetical protein
MQYALVVLATLLIVGGCGGKSPTQPSPASAAPVAMACSLPGPVGSAGSSDFVPPATSSCKVSKASDARACSDAVKGRQFDAIEVTSVIECGNGSDSCAIDVSGVTRPITIFGTTQAAGFRRRGSYTYPIVNVSGTRNATVARLTFDEGEGLACDGCISTIFADTASSVVLDELRILHSKRMGIQARGVSGLSLQDSEIVSSGVFGIWFGIEQSAGVRIENNRFTDVRSNAIFLEKMNDVLVARNTLTHNHRDAIFTTSTCGGPCPGGQIYLQEVDQVRIEANVIKDGRIDLGNSRGDVGGIEFDRAARGVTVYGNEIVNNRGNGVYANVFATDVQALLERNVLRGNGRSYSGFDGRDVRLIDNCTSQQPDSSSDPRERGIGAVRFRIGG